MEVKKSWARLVRLAVAVLGVIAVSTDAQAAISSINVLNTSASITFDDTFSLDPILTPGVTNSGPSANPWNGAPLIMPLTTDPVTSDFANATLDATFLGNAYAVNFTNVLLNQAITSTGTAHLNFAFTIEYQLDAAGLPAQATLFPNFAVNGTVQNIAGSFAAVTGFINYIGVNTAGTIGVVETVNYNSIWSAPGNFVGVAVGVPVSGTTPLFVPNTTLTLNGAISFQVDPASINATSVMVPEPASAALLAFAGLIAAGRVSRQRSRA
jgi:hypothetical protein